MSSKTTVIVPGAIYQVCSLGPDTHEIFSNDSLKEFFRESLSRTLQKYSYRCYGWSLLNDHYHIVVKSSDNPINEFVHNLNTSYAVHYSRNRGRQGAVFGHRFSTVIVQEEPYLKPLVRWMHLNPVRKGLCTLENLDNYKWSSNFAITNNCNDGVIDSKRILEKFQGADPIEEYRAYLRSQQKDPLYEHLVDSLRFANKKHYNFSKAESWVIGDSAYTSLMFSRNLNKRVNVARHITENISLDDISHGVTSLMKIDIHQDFRARRSNVVESAAYEVFAFVASYKFDYSRDQLGDYLKVGYNAVTRLINKGQAFCEGNSFLQKVCDTIAASKTAQEFSNEISYMINDL
jgi:putative transposase